MPTLYSEMVSSTYETVLKKVKDSNKIHVTSTDPHQRTVMVDRVHSRVFKGAFGTKIGEGSEEEEENQCFYSVESLDNVIRVLGKSAIKITGDRDVCIVTPWQVLLSELDGGPPGEFCAGKLVLPITKGPLETLCFLPCGGLDFETDDVPTWANKIPLSCISSSLLQSDLAGDYPSLKDLGKGKINFVSKTDHLDILPGQSVEEGDRIVCNGEEHIIRTVGPNAFYREGTADVVTFTDILVEGKWVRDKWVKNGNEKTYHIIRMPFLYGQMREINNEKLESLDNVNIKLNKISSHNVGTVNITYKNACFNPHGFMIHDSHIAI